MENCLFCRIIQGEISVHKVYEDEATLAFLDIKPVNPGHLLVIAKRHSRNLEETSGSDWQALALTVQQLGRRLKEKLGAPAYNVGLNNGAEAGQEIEHLHVHLIPRYADDGHQSWSRKSYGAGEEEAVKDKLTS
jgi:histidine triad (HIT) family protein